MGTFVRGRTFTPNFPVVAYDINGKAFEPELQEKARILWDTEIMLENFINQESSFGTEKQTDK